MALMKLALLVSLVVQGEAQCNWSGGCHACARACRKQFNYGYYCCFFNNCCCYAEGSGSCSDHPACTQQMCMSGNGLDSNAKCADPSFGNLTERVTGEARLAVMVPDEADVIPRMGG